MMRITLTTGTGKVLQALPRDVSQRDQIEMLFLSEEGWSAPIQENTWRQ